MTSFSAGDVRITPFQTHHQAAAVRLINANLGKRFGCLDESMNPDLFDIARSFSQGGFLVALLADQVVGTGGFLPVSPEQAQIVRMHTSSAHRRRGIATRLLEALELRILDRGFKSVCLETNLDWAEAIAFYRVCGYRVTGSNEVEIHFAKRLNHQRLNH